LAQRKYDFFDCFKTSYVDTGTTCPCNTSYPPRMCAACQHCRCKISYIAHCHVAYIFLGYNDHRSIHNIALWYLTILRKLCLVLCVESIVKKQECMTPFTANIELLACCQWAKPRMLRRGAWFLYNLVGAKPHEL